MVDNDSSLSKFLKEQWNSSPDLLCCGTAYAPLAWTVNNAFNITGIPQFRTHLSATGANIRANFFSMMFKPDTTSSASIVNFIPEPYRSDHIRQIFSLLEMGPSQRLLSCGRWDSVARDLQTALFLLIILLSGSRKNFAIAAMLLRICRVCFIVEQTLPFRAYALSINSSVGTIVNIAITRNWCVRVRNIITIWMIAARINGAGFDRTLACRKSEVTGIKVCSFLQVRKQENGPV